MATSGHLDGDASADTAAEPAAAETTSERRSSDSATFKSSSCVLRLRGLPFNATQSDVATFFEPFSVRETVVCKRAGERADGVAVFSSSALLCRAGSARARGRARQKGCRSASDTIARSQRVARPPLLLAATRHDAVLMHPSSWTVQAPRIRPPFWGRQPPLVSPAPLPSQRVWRQSRRAADPPTQHTKHTHHKHANHLTKTNNHAPTQQAARRGRRLS